jgi:GrpB-like predicted nucleotidyltransferase (UPF0157 family)
MAEDMHPVRQGPTTQAQLRAVTIGPLASLTGHVELADYDPTWPGLFEREATRIRRALGDRVRRLEHVGSTSVPGLAAKPVVDILLVVEDTSDESAYLPPMEAAGYVLRIREPDWHEHRLFKGPDTNVNVHVFPVGCAEIERMLLFRDRLRTDAMERESYERTKCELAARDWRFTQEYADAKAEIVEAIIRRARMAAVDPP